MKEKKIRIECDGDGRLAKNYRMFLNDEEISHMVRGFELNVHMDKSTTIKVEFCADVQIPEGIAVVEHGR